jgi:ABC-type glutathione transport system ATPase component
MSLDLAGATKRYKIRATGTEINALNGISLSLPEGKTLGIVGESGCGKSTLARLIVGLEKPTEGSILWRGQEIADKSHDAFRTRLSKTQLVFQDPYSSLNPRQRIGECIAEVIRVHNLRPEN